VLDQLKKTERNVNSRIKYSCRKMEVAAQGRAGWKHMGTKRHKGESLAALRYKEKERKGRS